MMGQTPEEFLRDSVAQEILANDPPPALVAAGDQVQQQAIMDAMRFVYLLVAGNAADEVGDKGTANEYQIERMTWFLQLGKLRTQAMVLALTKVFANSLCELWGGSWVRTLEAMADPDLPLFPGGHVHQDDMPRLD